MRLVIAASLLSLGCAAATADDDAAMRDASPRPDALLAPDAPSLDATSPVDAASFDPCRDCARDRCTAGAVDCLDDAACVAMVDCMAACSGTAGCREGCEASTGVPFSRTYDVTLCRSACALACSDVSPRPEMCQPTLAPCETRVPGFDCCAEDETCIEPPPGRMNPAHCCADGYCCASGEQACGPDHPCCNGEPCEAGRCAELTCGRCDLGLPCCHPAQACIGASLGGTFCCAPDGTPMPDDADSTFCCSNWVHDGRCGPP